MKNKNVSCVSNNCNQDSGGVENSKIDAQLKKLHCSNRNLSNILDDTNNNPSNSKSLDEINVDVEDLSHLGGLTLTDAERLHSKLTLDILNIENEAIGPTENGNEEVPASLQSSNIPNTTSTDENGLNAVVNNDGYIEMDPAFLEPNDVVNDDDYIVMDPVFLEQFVAQLHQLYPHLYDLPLDD